MNFLSKLFPAPTVDSAVASISKSFDRLDRAVEKHTNLCAAANERARTLRDQANEADYTSRVNYEAGARAQRIKLRLSDLLG